MLEWKPKRLDDTQDRIVKECLSILQSDKKVHKIPWISGFAGNGKSVVLVYTMETLAALDKKSSIAFITYTHALIDLIHHSLLPSFKNRIVVKTHTNFISDKNSYDYVFIDEIQDISKVDLLKIQSYSGSIVFAGDFAQSIYPANKPISLTSLKNDFKVEEYKLLKMFRLTKLLAEVVMKLLPTGSFSKGEYSILGEEVPPRLFSFNSTDEEFEWVWKEANQWASTKRPAVILFPFRKDIESFLNFVSNLEGLGYIPRISSYSRDTGISDPYGEINTFFDDANLDTLLQVLGSGSGKNALKIASSKKVIFLMTFHSSKGLDFDSVFVPSLDYGKKLYPGLASSKNAADLENKLLFVALTRSRKNLFMSFSGDKPHSLVSKLGLKPIQPKELDDSY